MLLSHIALFQDFLVEMGVSSFLGLWIVYVWACYKSLFYLMHTFVNNSRHIPEKGILRQMMICTTIFFS